MSPHARAYWFPPEMVRRFIGFRRHRALARTVQQNKDRRPGFATRLARA